MASWKDIHEDFDKSRHSWSKKYQQIWEELNITYSEAQELVKVGFKPSDWREIKKIKDEEIFDLKETKKWTSVLLDLATYAVHKGHHPNQINWEELRKEYYYAQNWLDFHYPKEKRGQIAELGISSENLMGELDLSDFKSLKSLFCFKNNLTNCNFLVTVPNPEKLTILDLSNNNITQDLTIFSRFKNLGHLEINNNPFLGSLEFLSQCEKLEYLNISDTNINSGAEYLPNNLKTIHFSTKKKPNSKVKDIKKQLEQKQLEKLQKKWEEWDFSYEEAEEWITFGLTSQDYELAAFLRNNKYRPISDYDLKELKKKYSENLAEWKDIHSDFNYSL
ncbi:MAG: leucine-rich repeat domain-containing protein [Candidatus Moeniiplasma glomeromycotorum]|nr:leucine-rich repeat domain-containing protein [Candidatus Moeniiplasma glomeromycotorum]MCE8167280.1 leucine-rich repeat domain-containing protein [Candidatus Moeniiplasma glomeromycotorum]MCE8168707.1 leucine-rich repeat domain-containing protein [Candidatus Moeniiplasma glomeromycotorum]